MVDVYAPYRIALNSIAYKAYHRRSPGYKPEETPKSSQVFVFSDKLMQNLSDRTQQALRIGITSLSLFKDVNPPYVKVHICTDNDKLLNTVTIDFQICGDRAFI